jgi:phenylacetate-CoA ligase
MLIQIGVNSRKALGKLTERSLDWLSPRVLIPAARLRRRIRPSQRGTFRNYIEGAQFRLSAKTWDREQRRGWILKRLRHSVRRAYRETEFYRMRLESIGFDPFVEFGFDDFAQIPVLEREDIRNAPERIVSRSVPPHLLKRDSTGGSTGEPTEIRLGPEEAGWRESAGDWFQERLEVGPGARTAFLWGHHLDPVRSDTLRDRVYALQYNLRWFDCFRLSREVLAKYHREFERYQPACIVAYASALAALARYLRDERFSPGYPTRCLVTGAEKLADTDRELIESVFRKPVHERYGSRDVGFVAYQLDLSNSHDFEIDWANLLVEPEREETDSPILITKLHADAMPMLRYRIGDIGRFPISSRPGHPTFALAEVLGRETDRICLPDGRWIHGIEIPHLMKEYPITTFMLSQRSDYSVDLQIVPSTGFDDSAQLAIESAIGANLPGLSLRVSVVQEIPKTKSNKWRPVVSDVRPSIDEVAQRAE